MEGFSIVPGGNLGYENYCKELLPPTDSMQIPLPMNSEVQRGLDFLTKHKIGKPFFKKTLERTTKWFPMLRKIAIEEGMPQEIIYLAMIESGLNPNAVSRAKAGRHVAVYERHRQDVRLKWKRFRISGRKTRSYKSYKSGNETLARLV
jgi:hypothetical protein